MLLCLVLEESPIPDAVGHRLNHPGMCPFLANMATAFSSIVSERALSGRMAVACRSCHSFLEVDEGAGQLAPLPFPSG